MMREGKEARLKFLCGDIYADRTERLKQYVELLTQEKTLTVLGQVFTKTAFEKAICHTGFIVRYESEHANLLYEDYISITLTRWAVRSKCGHYIGDGETSKAALQDMHNSIKEDMARAESNLAESKKELTELRATWRILGPKKT